MYGFSSARNSRRGPARSGPSTSDRWLRTPPDLSLPPRDELVIKILVAWQLPGVDVREVIQTHRRYLVELMQQWTGLKEDEAQSGLGFALAVDAELFRLDSVMRWLDTADGRLRSTVRARPRCRPLELDARQPLE